MNPSAEPRSESVWRPLPVQGSRCQTDSIPARRRATAKRRRRKRPFLGLVKIKAEQGRIGTCSRAQPRHERRSLRGKQALPNSSRPSPAADSATTTTTATTNDQRPPTSTTNQQPLDPPSLLLPPLRPLRPPHADLRPGLSAILTAAPSARCLSRQRVPSRPR
jgi:hypothetical protein